ncbi:ferrochelatase [Kistimonas scapharcae]|uniref:Ferrochelatase n=1 Tax=Kistimonas scapharcae TaxID=1036133 RepID=A0ABP8V7J7_9GAMM
MQGRAVLLVNLGSPDSPEVSDVRRYLNEFLMDKYVIDLPWPLRRLIVSAFVLPSRPKQSAEAYQSVWLPEGSPLKVISEKVRKKLQAQTDIPIRLAMRYGSPSIEQELLALAGQAEVKEILLLPMYPHYAMSTVKTCIEEAQRIMQKHGIRKTLNIHPVFYNQPDYIHALVESARPWLEQEFDHLLFSYHGVPERHIRKDDTTGNHCLTPDCCQKPSTAHATCYRHQLYETTAEFVRAAGIPGNRYSVAFQSRLGKAKWLEPYTDKTVEQLARQGVKRLLVMCPAFTADCLETLEEIAMQGQEIFEAAGGETLTLIPCLNDHPVWISTLKQWIEA